MPKRLPASTIAWSREIFGVTAGRAVVSSAVVTRCTWPPRECSAPTMKSVLRGAEVTADILLVGILGAWAVLVGVQLAIAAFTLRAPRPATTKTVKV